MVNSSDKPIPWYYNIICGSIAGSTAEVTIYYKLFIDIYNSIRHSKGQITNPRSEKSRNWCYLST